MVEVLRTALGVLAVMSLVTIALYVVLFLVVAAWTVVTGHGRDPQAEELDRFLAEVLRPPAAVQHDAWGLVTRGAGLSARRRRHERKS